MNLNSNIYHCRGMYVCVLSNLNALNYWHCNSQSGAFGLKSSGLNVTKVFVKPLHVVI